MPQPLRREGHAQVTRVGFSAEASGTVPHPPAPSPHDVERGSLPPVISVVSSVIPAKAGIHVPRSAGGQGYSMLRPYGAGFRPAPE